MAKQSGIHQLRGKVGEHSYYQQTGVNGGLVRRINQGMAERVKTDAAFANTRLNNAEFGQAGAIAAMLAQYITPKYRPMVLPFSQSKMAKSILEVIKQDSTSQWGQRNLTVASSGDATVTALNLVSKNRFDDFGLLIECDDEQQQLRATLSNSTFEKMRAIGADEVRVRLIFTQSWIGTYQPTERKYAQSFARATTDDSIIIDESGAGGDDFVIDASWRPAPPQGWPAIMAERVVVAIILPVRNVNETAHILQEHCTFKAFPFVDGQV